MCQESETNFSKSQLVCKYDPVFISIFSINHFSFSVDDFSTYIHETWRISPKNDGDNRRKHFFKRSVIKTNRYFDESFCWGNTQDNSNQACLWHMGMFSGCVC